MEFLAQVAFDEALQVEVSLLRLLGREQRVVTLRQNLFEFGVTDSSVALLESARAPTFSAAGHTGG